MYQGSDLFYLIQGYMYRAVLEISSHIRRFLPLDIKFLSDPPLPLPQRVDCCIVPLEMPVLVSHMLDLLDECSAFLENNTAIPIYLDGSLYLESQD